MKYRYVAAQCSGHVTECSLTKIKTAMRVAGSESLRSCLLPLTRRPSYILVIAPCRDATRPAQYGTVQFAFEVASGRVECAYDLQIVTFSADT